MNFKYISTGGKIGHCRDDFWKTYIGETIYLGSSGTIFRHVLFDTDGNIVHDFKRTPVSEETKLFLSIKHGVPLLPKSAFE